MADNTTNKSKNIDQLFSSSCNLVGLLFLNKKPETIQAIHEGTLDPLTDNLGKFEEGLKAGQACALEMISSRFLSLSIDEQTPENLQQILRAFIDEIPPPPPFQN